MPHLPQARVVELPGGMIPAPDQLPAEWAALVADFVDAEPRNTASEAAREQLGLVDHGLGRARRARIADQMHVRKRGSSSR